MLIKARAWYVRLFVAVARYVPEGVIPFTLEAARVEHDTTTWVRVLTKTSKHRVCMSVPDTIENSTRMQTLYTHLPVEVWAEYEDHYDASRRTRLWCMTGTKSSLKSAVALIQGFDPLSSIYSPTGIHPI